MCLNSFKVINYLPTTKHDTAKWYPHLGLTTQFELTAPNNLDPDYHVGELPATA